MLCREAARVGVLGQIVQSQNVGSLKQHAQQSFTGGQLTDLGDGRRVESILNE